MKKRRISGSVIFLAVFVIVAAVLPLFLKKQ